jgi:predicted metal-dependent phosphoesterase TrpH
MPPSENSPKILQKRQKIDLHMHTVEDPMDAHVWHTAEELLDKAARLGFTVLAITLHNRQFESPRITAYAAERGILLLPGVEQEIEGRHVLLINFPREVANGIRTFQELREAKGVLLAQGRSLLVIAAHPFFPNAICLKEKLFEHADVFDAIEISGFYHRFWDANQKAREAATHLGLPMVGNSDTHTLDQFGTQWTEVECESTPEAVIAALKQGRGHVRGRSLRWHEMALITYKVVARGYMPWIDYKKQRGIPAKIQPE